MTEQPNDAYAWTNLDVRLEDVWKAHKVVDEIENERDEAIEAAMAKVNNYFVPLLLEAKSVEYEVQARVLRSGFTIQQVSDYLDEKHPEDHTPS